MQTLQNLYCWGRLCGIIIDAQVCKMTNCLLILLGSNLVICLFFSGIRSQIPVSIKTLVLVQLMLVCDLFLNTFADSIRSSMAPSDKPYIYIYAQFGWGVGKSGKETD